MNIPEKAAAYMERIAADDSHGYDQSSRWGNPDYDCSSLVISAYKDAGVALKCTYTGNMRADMLSHGFRDVTAAVNLATGAGLLRGDVLLHERNHTAMYIGGGMLVHARGNEYGGVTGGQPGDQTGREVCKQTYFNFPWDSVLRYEENTGAGGVAEDINVPATPDTYTVQQGDMLGLIALRFGTTIRELARINNIRDVDVIFPGQVLKIRDDAGSVSSTPAASNESSTETKTESEITAMAKAVIRGEYGNGLVRRIRLGKYYDKVQAEVNRLLMGR